MSVTIKVGKGKDGKQHVYLKAPYTPEMPPKARLLGGQWHEGSLTWIFDPRDEARVRELAVDLYSTDGSAPVLTADLRVDLDALKVNATNPMQSLRLAGREVCYRPMRDAATRVGDDVVVVAGGFHKSGGSARYPHINALAGTVLEVRDVPLLLAEKEAEAHPDAVTITRRDEPSMSPSDEPVAAGKEGE